MHDFCKQILLKVDRQKTIKNLIENSSFVVKANRISLSLCQKNKEQQ